MSKKVRNQKIEELGVALAHHHQNYEEYSRRDDSCERLEVEYDKIDKVLTDELKELAMGDKLKCMDI